MSGTANEQPLRATLNHKAKRCNHDHKSYSSFCFHNSTCHLHNSQESD